MSRPPSSPRTSRIIQDLFGSGAPIRTKGAVDDVIVIARSQILRTRFRRAFRELNDSDVKTSVREAIRDLALDLTASADRKGGLIELLDRAGLAPAAAIATAGVVSFVASAGMAGPILLGAGTIAMVATGYARVVIRREADTDREDAGRLILLLEILE